VQPPCSRLSSAATSIVPAAVPLVAATVVVRRRHCLSSLLSSVVVVICHRCCRLSLPLSFFVVVVVVVVVCRHCHLTLGSTIEIKIYLFLKMSSRLTCFPCPFLSFPLRSCTVLPITKSQRTGIGRERAPCHVPGGRCCRRRCRLACFTCRARSCLSGPVRPFLLCLNPPEVVVRSWAGFVARGMGGALVVVEAREQGK
jgi:hypothetical protein